ncbi:sensor histidine kinase [Clostridium sp. B9]|uniref:sensor histidine kinase n=1 Tax=Clostridium sp. B9 TaxID=3423224 RepID=UPI003D2F3559
MGKRVIKWFLGKASIRKKLIISFSILVSIPIILLGIYAFSESRQNLMAQTEKTMVNNMKSITNELDSRFKKEESYAKYLAYNLNFRRVIENKSSDNISIAQTLNETVEPIFWYFITSDSYIKEIDIYTPNVNEEIGSFLKPSTLVEDEEWYKNSERNFKTFYQYDDGKIFLTRAILDTKTNSRVIGVLRMEFFNSIINEPVEKMNYLGNGIIIKDNKNSIVTVKVSNNKKIDKLVMEEVLNSSGDLGEILDKKRYLICDNEIDSIGLRVFYYINKANITDELMPIIESTLLIVGICLVLEVVLISVLSKLLSKRILLLKDKAEEIAEGNFKRPIFTEDTDEIGAVTNSLGNMSEQLNEMINRVYKIELEKKATELKALQAMINPHFLYNTLSTIKWKAIREGNDDISDITGHLAKFYRTSLNNGQELTTVKNEIDNIKSYMEIQRLAHSNNFDVEYIIDEEGMECKMLNFILQPIAENAIKHGIDCNYGGERGKIKLEFNNEKDNLVFNIYNTNYGDENIDLEIILNSSGKGYGISNIRERIELYYDIKCNLKVEKVDGIYVCVSLKLPKIK